MKLGCVADSFSPLRLSMRDGFASFRPTPTSKAARKVVAELYTVIIIFLIYKPARPLRSDAAGARPQAQKDRFFWFQVEAALAFSNGTTPESVEKPGRLSNPDPSEMRRWLRTDQSTKL